MLVASSSPVRLGVPRARALLGFEQPTRPPTEPRRLLLDGEPAFELSWWCGTCPFLFRRQRGANQRISSVERRLERLEGPLEEVERDVVAWFAPLLGEATYLPILLELTPRLVAPHDEDDYFTHEQVATWGVDPFWGLPHDPRSWYYRTYETPVGTDPASGADQHLYEFVVPMVPPGWNDGERVAHYAASLSTGTTPTAVALSTLDVCQPALADESADYHGHWGLTHFLLDGHHKMAAAAAADLPVRLLALVSLEDSLASSADLRRLVELRGQEAVGRPAQPSP